VTSGTARLEGGLASRDRWSARDRCSIGKAFDVIGTRSALLILREAYYGTRRFDDFAERVGINPSVAASRLKDLVAAGLLVLVPYREPGSRTRSEYELTEMGRDLVPAVFALMLWGDRHLQFVDGPPLALVHSECRRPVTVRLVCSDGHDVPLEEISVLPA
jgi:DNA-binding HxlR family transcriptional regulator